MTTQLNRHRNLRAVLADLERDGYTTREAQASYLGGAVTAGRLDAMLAGADVSPLLAGHIEHVLFKPRGWMSESHPGLPAPGQSKAFSSE